METIIKEPKITLVGAKRIESYPKGRCYLVRRPCQ
jgi:hypothetical protein